MPGDIHSLPTRGGPVTSVDGVPTDYQAERVVLGSCMAYGAEVFAAVADYLRPDDFAKPQHRIVWEAMGELIGRGDGISNTDVLEYLLRAPATASRLARIEEAGGASVVLGHQIEAVFPELVHGYARRVREYAVRAEIIAKAAALVESARSSAVTLSDLARSWDAAGEVLHRADPASAETVQIGEAAARVIQQTQARAEGRIEGVYPTGLAALDKHLGGGLQAGDLVIMGGRPAMGKTAFALSLALKASRRGTGVLVMSLELVESIAARRILAQESHVDGMTLKTGYDLQGRPISNDDFRRAIQAVDRLRDRPLWLNSRGGQSLSTIRAEARKQKRAHPELRIVVVDYLQIMAMGGGKNDSMHNRITETAQGLRNLGKEEGLAMVVLSQLKRDVDTREGQRPCNADLRDSGGIEAAATRIWFPWRPAVVTKAADPREAKLLVTKNTDGTCEEVPFTWHGAYQEFADEEVERERMGFPSEVDDDWAR